jgi:hypothetical protein
MAKPVFITNSPFVGPRPFEARDGKLFFGRKREIEELLSLIIAHRTVLVYAQSGAGKTSLLKAGVIPLLERRSFKVLPPARVEGLMPAGVTARDVGNIFVFHTLQYLAKAHANLAGRTLPSFLKSLALDVPDERGERSPAVLVLDQFEEFFTCNVERWQERVPFFEQLAESLETIPNLKVVFVMREEFLAQLELFAEHLPKKLRNRMHLERLREKAALDAIIGPLRLRCLDFEDGAAEELVRDLRKIRVAEGGRTIETYGEFVEPVHLQVVCQALWESLPKDFRSASSDGSSQTRKITRSHVEAFGDVSNALAKYYDRAIENACRGLFNEAQLRRLIAECLITPAGTRGMVFTASKDFAEVPVQTLEALDRAHVIHVEERAGTGWYELTHDRFIEAIQESDRNWAKRFGKAEENRKWLEQRADSFLNGGSPLEEAELLLAERFVATDEAEALGLSTIARQLVNASRHAVDRQEQQRRDDLEQAKRRAELEREEAEAQRRWAELQRQEAEAQKQRAELQQREAKAQAQIAERERKLRKRDRRNALLLIAAVVCTCSLVSYSLYDKVQNLRREKKTQRSLSEQRFRRADRDLASSSPVKDAFALHDLAIALRYNPRNIPAARLACKLLLARPWCPALTAPLHYPNAAILAATFSPDRQVFGLASDGHLFRYDYQKSETLEILEKLFPGIDPDEQHAILLPTALFSEDGSVLAVILPQRVSAIVAPIGDQPSHADYREAEKSLTAKVGIWRWNAAARKYAAANNLMDVNGGSANPSSICWSGDGKTLIILTSQNEVISCHVFNLRTGEDTYVLDPEASERLSKSQPVAVAINPEDGGIATLSSTNKIQFFDAGCQPVQRAIKGAEALRKIPLAFRNVACRRLDI